MKNLVTILLLFATSLSAQNSSNARSVGLSGAYSCLAVGSEALSFNPANLSFPLSYSTTIGVIGIGGQMANNAYTFNDYKFYNGRYITEPDKSALLSSIPSDRLFINGSIYAHALSFSHKSFAFSANVFTAAHSNIAKEVLDLALNGNQLNREYSFKPAKAEGYAIGQIAASYGAKLPVMSPRIKHMGIGFTVKYLRGFSYYAVANSGVYTKTEISKADAFGNILYNESTGGNGYGLDLGSTILFNKSRVALVLENAVSQLIWNENTKATQYHFQLEEENAEKFFTSELAGDSLFTSTDTSYARGDIYTNLPTIMRIGYLYPYKKLLVAAEITQGFRETALSSKTPRLAVGLEYQPGNFIHLRWGSRISKEYGLSTSWGFGILSGIVRWDIGIRLYDALLPKSSKGLSFATSLILRI